MTDLSRPPVRNCHLCGERMDGAWARVTFEGFRTLDLNGVTFVIHARCLQFQPLPTHNVEPESEAELREAYGK